MHDAQLLTDLQALDKLFTSEHVWMRSKMITAVTPTTNAYCLAGGLIKVVVNPKTFEDYNVILLLEPRIQHMRRALAFDHISDLINYND